ncbi:MAG: PBP1A family penicillin-binding protein [Terricaulis sp.]
MADENDPNRPEEPPGPPEAAAPELALEPGADAPEILEPPAEKEEAAGTVETALVEDPADALKAAGTSSDAPPEAGTLALESSDAGTEPATTFVHEKSEAPIADAAEVVAEDLEPIVSSEADEAPIGDAAEIFAEELEASFADAPTPVEDAFASPEDVAEPPDHAGLAAEGDDPQGEHASTASVDEALDGSANPKSLADGDSAAKLAEAPAQEVPDPAAREFETAAPEMAAAPDAEELQDIEPVAAEKAADLTAIPIADERAKEQQNDEIAEPLAAPIETQPHEAAQAPEYASTIELPAGDAAAIESRAPPDATGAEAPPSAPEQRDQGEPAAALEAASVEAAPEHETAESEAHNEQTQPQAANLTEQALEDVSAEASELVNFDDDVPASETKHEEDPSYEPVPQTAESGEASQLPPNYFQAAGDPKEPVEPPPTFFGRAQQRLGDFLGFAARLLGPFAGAARNFGGGMWRGVRDIKHPRNVREVAVWGGWAAAAVTTLIVGFFVFVTWGMPSTDDLWEARNGQSITFLDRNGNVILREGAQNAPPVDLQSLPPFVAQAFVAIEDRRFHQHWGIDFEGMMRAGAQNIRAGRVVQGGSTITQQLAKNLFLTNERSWRRKAQEIALAVWLETKFTKEEILALYLSRVYFGAGAYGIEAAAERYFDRPARELTLLQSAMIAGLVKAPSRLNPANQDIASARTRAEIVLQEMVSLNFISDTERQAALNEELVVSRRNPAGVLSYYRDWIDPLLNDVIGTQRDDFIIETTIDIQSQRAGADAVEAVLAEQGESRRASQAALLSMDDDGEVLAMVGGRDYDTSQFNRATQARRQPGSSFKYFIYLAAMESGLTPWSIRNDAPITIHIEGQPDWTPGNYHEEFNGPVELVRAFAQSYNMVAIRVASEVGGQHVIDVAHRLGVTSELHNYHSLALGAQEVTLLEMTQAFGAMASQGYRVQAHGVSRIRRAHDEETMWSWRQTGGPTRVIEERPLRYMNYMMSRVVESGTGTAARMNGRQIGGKTGTANDYRDAWFVGFTPGIVTGVWVGNDDHRIAMARVTGGQLPAAIWARFMPTALRNVPVRELQMPGPDDYEVGRPDPISPTLTAVGAPLGNAPPMAGATDAEDRSLDFGPEG